MYIVLPAHHGYTCLFHKIEGYVDGLWSTFFLRDWSYLTGYDPGAKLHL